MRTIVYIDGFNLYYRMLRQRPEHKWLNPYLLAKEVLDEKFEVVCVNYYTARLSARANDPHGPSRQATYLKALGSVPEVRIHEGNFLVSTPWMPLADPPRAKPESYEWSLPAPSLVKVLKTEEKGSDVNLAAHLVRDAFTDRFDVGVVLTNDSDLVEPIRIVTREAGKPVGLLVPVKYPTASLARVSSFQLHLRPGHLRRAQFPPSIALPDGSTIARPETWSAAEQ